MPGRAGGALRERATLISAFSSPIAEETITPSTFVSRRLGSWPRWIRAPARLNCRISSFSRRSEPETFAPPGKHHCSKSAHSCPADTHEVISLPRTDHVRASLAKAVISLSIDAVARCWPRRKEFLASLVSRSWSSNICAISFAKPCSKISFSLARVQASSCSRTRAFFH